MIKCDICHNHDAIVDGKTVRGGWAYMCENCFILYGKHIKGLYTYLPSERTCAAAGANSQDTVNEAALQQSHLVQAVTQAGEKC